MQLNHEKHLIIAVKKLTNTIDNISLNNLKYFLKYCINYNKKLILLLINIEIYKISHKKCQDSSV